MIEQPITFKNNKGQQLVGILHKTKSNKGIVLCHGLQLDKTGFHRSFVNLAWKLVEAGFNVLRFDFSCAGDSQGRSEDSSVFQMVNDLNCAINLFEKKGIKTIGVLGHSLGALVGILQSIKDNRIKSLVAWAPPFVIKKATQVAIQKRFIFWKGFKIKLKLLKERNKLVKLCPAPKISIPFLIIHGDKDINCALSASERFIKDVSSIKKLVIVRGADHFFRYKQDRLIDETIDWFKKYC